MRQRQLHRRPAGLRRLIQREDQFHGFPTFGAVDSGLLAGADGGDGFFEIGAMPGVADRLRVVGACAAAFGGWGNNRGVRRQGLFEFERGQLVVARDGPGVSYASRPARSYLGGAGGCRGRAGGEIPSPAAGGPNGPSDET